MLHNAGDKGVGLFGQAVGAAGIAEEVFTLPEEGHIDVHARAALAGDGLRHKGGVEAVALGDGLDCQLEGHHIVRRPEGLLIAEINLVLAGGHLMMAGLHGEAHLLQAQADLPAGGLALIQGAQIKIARPVTGLGGGHPTVVRLEEEELALGADIQSIAQVRRLALHPAQHLTGVAHKGGAVSVVHITQEPTHLASGGTPGVDGKAVQIRVQVLVGLIDMDKALNGGSVDHHPAVHGLLQLRDGDRHIFQFAEYIHKLHPDEFHILLLDDPDNIFSGISHLQKCLPLPAVPAAVFPKIRREPVSGLRSGGPVSSGKNPVPPYQYPTLWGAHPLRVDE